MTTRLGTNPVTETNPLPIVLVPLTPGDALVRLESQITNSYAHNSLLYETLAKSADLETITHFLRWDAKQPAFSVYLRHWLDKTPKCILQELVDHIAIEENEHHSALFIEMLDHLDAQVSTPTTFDEDRLTRLNYTFSAECASEQDAGFFLGSFWATEIMSAKRCGQIYDGLLRNGVPDSVLEYMHIHVTVDAGHGDEVRDHFIKPVLEQTPEIIASIQRGVQDRLLRSAEYLMWYELALLPNIT